MDAANNAKSAAAEAAASGDWAAAVTSYTAALKARARRSSGSFRGCAF